MHACISYPPTHQVFVVERSQPVCPPYKLQLEECLSAEQVPTTELIQGYVKKHIQDAADQGVMFVGFVQEPYGAPCTRIREPDTPSFSLHSSPSSVLGSLRSCSPSNPSSPINHAAPGAEADAVDKEGNEDASCKAGEEAPGGEKNHSENTGNHSGSGVEGSQGVVLPVAPPIPEEDLEQSEELTEEESPCHNNNKDSGRDAKERPRYRLRRGDVTHTWHHRRPQTTGPSGPPHSAFCSEIIPHCLVLILPQLRCFPSTPTLIPLNLCDNASRAGVVASRGGRGACQAPMSLSTKAQSAEEAQESRLPLACPC
ncbi:hypothetical protein FQN60_017229 [Etheostoma spectabile]|uniref:Uncharacterized protein n=1 Tax=Etheostoma spectabile TaxID=54343 RepID=A0A5J5DEV9_9PERO|nr:hypothetical protein FQN60_017229 [Etheostoma spectabile]